MRSNVSSRLLALLLSAVLSASVLPPEAFASVPIRSSSPSDAFKNQALIGRVTHVISYLEKKVVGTPHLKIRQAEAEFSKETHNAAIERWAAVRDGFLIAAALSGASAWIFYLGWRDWGLTLMATSAALSLIAGRFRAALAQDVRIAGSVLVAPTQPGAKTVYYLRDESSATRTGKQIFPDELVDIFLEGGLSKPEFERRLMTLARIAFEEQLHGDGMKNEFLTKSIAVIKSWVWRLLARPLSSRISLKGSVRALLELNSEVTVLEVVAEDEPVGVWGEMFREAENNLHFLIRETTDAYRRSMKRSFSAGILWLLLFVLPSIGWGIGYLLPDAHRSQTNYGDLVEAHVESRTQIDQLQWLDNLPDDFRSGMVGRLSKDAQRGRFFVSFKDFDNKPVPPTSDVLEYRGSDVWRGTDNIEKVRIGGYDVSHGRTAFLYLPRYRDKNGDILVEMEVTIREPNKPFTVRNRHASIHQDGTRSQDKQILLFLAGLAGAVAWMLRAILRGGAKGIARLWDERKERRLLPSLLKNPKLREFFDELKTHVVHNQIKIVRKISTERHDTLAGRSSFPQASAVFSYNTDAPANAPPITSAEIRLNPLLENDSVSWHDHFVHETIEMLVVARLIRAYQEAVGRGLPMEGRRMISGGIDFLIESGFSDWMTYWEEFIFRKELELSPLEHASVAFQFFTYGYRFEHSFGANPLLAARFFRLMSLNSKLLSGGLMRYRTFWNYMHHHQADIEPLLKAFHEALNRDEARFIPNNKWVERIDPAARKALMEHAQKIVDEWKREVGFDDQALPPNRRLVSAG